MLAVKYYLSLPLPEKPSRKEDIKPAIEIHHHSCKAEEYDLAAEIILQSNVHVYLDIWGDYITCQGRFKFPYFGRFKCSTF